MRHDATRRARCKSTKYSHRRAQCVYPKYNAYCTFRVNREPPLDMRSLDDDEDRDSLEKKRSYREAWSSSLSRRVLFERVPSIINLPGELFRAIDVESADVLVPRDAKDMSCSSSRLYSLKNGSLPATIVTVCTCTSECFHFDASGLFSA